MYITDVQVDKLSPENRQGLGVPYDEKEKEMILSWLRSFEAAAFTSAPVVDAFTGKTVADADNKYTDGQYMWYESEIYYFEKYDLRLTESFIGYAMCKTCPRMQPYYPVGTCECGTPGLMLDTKTHGVVCPVCGAEYAVSIVIPGNCDKAVMWGRYTVTIKPPLTLEQLRRLARIVDESSITLYKQAKEGNLWFEGLSYGQAFWLRTMLIPMGVEMDTTPELQKYERYLECHGRIWEVRAPYGRRIPTKVVWLADEILRLRHSEEEWLALEKEFHDHWDVIGRAAQEYLEESGAGEALAMVCSGIRWEREKRGNNGRPVT